ncbi:MAG: PIG-L family deacetylase [Saprospiraceae bacterium]|nr:PIG-L family deacetylase [Saprospiraceae bacterium]
MMIFLSQARHRYITLASFFLLSVLTFSAAAQKPVKPSASDLHQAIKKLNVLGSVLYVAAHPDDENQRFISYCANQKLYEVTYLSLTRGDGGQNLIGPEIRELLGVLRTEELLMARSVDGGKQRFSRANDFGYSKNPDETLRIWDKDKVLSDVVWAMRETQPDVVVNRFFHTTVRPNHGHHTASAMLSLEAFDMAGRSDAYPEQLTLTRPWQPKRVFFNTSWFFYDSREAFEKADKTNLYSLDLGVYLPLKGKSNNEVAAEARSMHRCQGFGAMSTRGENLEWFDFIKGDRPKTKDPLSGIDDTWNRVAGGAPIGKILKKVEQNYRPDNPSASVPELLKAMKLIEQLPDGYWKRVKLTQIRDVIRGCLGLYLETTAADPTATPGETLQLHIEAINRSAQQVKIKSLRVMPALYDTTLQLTLDNNKNISLDRPIRMPADAGFTGPYWLQQPFNIGMYEVPQQPLRGMPETPRIARAEWIISVNGVDIPYQTDVAFKIEESAIGEVWRPFEIIPPALVSFGEASYIFSENKKNVTLRVRAGRDNIRGKVSLKTPSGWKATPVKSVDVELQREGQETEVVFSVEAPEGHTQGELEASVEVDGRSYAMQMVTIKYDHIPQQTVLLPARVHIARTDVQVRAKTIGYYAGAGDDIPAALRQIGCEVTMLQDKDMEPARLRQFDAVVLGIRAYNTKENLKFHQQQLFDYANQGGTLLIQYNNNFDLYVKDAEMTPFKLKLGRSRVTDETAEVRFLLPQHPALNTPNALTAKDFDNWVQERGLYFASEWGPEFAAPISCNDPGEKPADGSLLIAPYGKGQIVYTSLSFFRELPAGVPGAFRLFANLISLK